jgi:glycosyltransferase 2 family protein
MNTQETTAPQPWSGLERLRLSRLGGRRSLISLVVAAVLAAGAWFVIGEIATYSRLVAALRRANPWWLLLALAGTGLTYLGYALTYGVFSRVQNGPRPRARTRLRLTAGIFGAAVIATSAARLAVEYWSLRRMREVPAQAFSRVLALNIAFWAVLAAAAALAAAALLAMDASATHLGLKLAWLLVLPLCWIPAAYLSSPRRRSLAENRGGHLRRLAASVVRSLVLVRRVLRQREDLLPGGGGALLYWAGELLIVWAGLRAFGVTLGPAALVIGFTTGYASTILPLPAGGAGGVDAAATYALTLVGVPLAPALLATLVQRLFSYWVPIVIAALSLRSIKRLGGDLAATPRPTASA